MDDTKTKYLAELIQKSSSLTLSEKTEWLQLLSLMNDKQKTELERILATPIITKPTTVVAGQPMNHIANLPKMALPAAALGLRSFAPAQVPTQATHTTPTATAAVLEKPKSAEPPPLSIKLPESKPEKSVPINSVPEIKPIEKVVVKPTIIPPKPVPVTTILKNAPTNASSLVPNSLQASQPAQTVVTEKINKHTPLVVPTHEASELQAPVVPAKVAVSGVVHGSGVFKSLEDLSGLSATQFRATESSVLLESLMALVKQSDYFQVKFALEQSPVYKAYINMGKTLLDGNLDFQSAQAQLQTNNKEYLSQLEFERFTDILSSLQVN